MNERLNPRFFAGRYYHLKKLKACNEYVIEKYIKGKVTSVLDFGCGKCPYKPIFEPHLEKYVGADIELNEYAQLLIDIETGRVATPPNQFDVILSTQVLEHVTDPPSYLKEANRLLKEDGLLVLSTHGYWIYHPDPTDYWRWTRDGLEKIIKKEGFEIVETLGIMNRMASGLQLFQDGLINKLPFGFRQTWSGIFAVLQMIFDNGKLTNRDACVFMVVARKKTNPNDNV